MYFPFFISKRYILSKKGSGFINLLSVIAILGIALGTAALIITLSILNGFEKTLSEKVITFDSHIQISSYIKKLPSYEHSLPEIKNILAGREKFVSPYISDLAVVSNGKMTEGILVKGILDTVSISMIKKNIIEGSFDIDSSNYIIIGKKLSTKLNAPLGSRITLFALKNNRLPDAGNLPNIKRFYIKGIYQSGMAEFDDMNAYCNFDAAKELFDAGIFITGYDIQLNDFNLIIKTTNELDSQLSYPYATRSIYQLHSNIFTWIELQKKPIPIILGLIIIVAVFNIISTLLMIVLEKVSAIGILKSIGARKRQIMSVFLIEGSIISLIGVLAGNLLAYSLMKIQLTFNIISLPADIYFMSTVPINMKWEIFLSISVIAFILGVFASLIPSGIASRLKPINSIRFN